MTTSRMRFGAGRVTPESDEALDRDQAAQGSKGQGTTDKADCAATDAQRKRVATAQARAALIGLELAPLHDGAWRLSYAAFGAEGHVCTVPSLQAIEAALYSFEHMHAEVLTMMEGLRHG